MSDKWWIFFLIGVLLGLLGGWLFKTITSPRDSRPSVATPPQAPAPSPAFLEEPSKGAPDAPVTIVEFADFKCGFCVRHFTRTLPLIVTEYINTGKVRYIYRNFAFLGVESRWAAEASECAHEQGRFWEYHDKLFETVAAGSQLLRSTLKELAAGLGLDTAKFNACLDQSKYKAEVDEDIAAGREAGVTGTPSFVINGQLMVGAHPIETFRQKIEEALAKASK
ncbi:MAG: DsbA family protein [Candidatus Bipolaricaulota bacterium]|nr:DsbA family protein [Candidatus Bipolaricaulota bacterium]MCS7273992.1 DsbA family protein [Candidatus Bipolaricaulota bacterium]MDW8111345.1 DsbA family protein [Candidatus Bipolaricaulota bacterium]MDW8329235.1 DsbA family protein [Candidatus Bipolaricaulota bacterium]